MIILDGAMGTELQARGIDTTLPLWSARALMDAPDVVRAVHADYITAGAQVITVNTFRTNTRTLLRAGLPSSAPRELTQIAVQAAQTAREARGNIKIAGSVAPVEDCYSPELVPTDEALHAEHGEHVRNQVEAGVDFVLVETMNTIREAVAAYEACRMFKVPFWASFTLAPDGNLHSGQSLSDAVKAALSIGPMAVLVNCIPVAQVESALRVLGKVLPPGLPFGAYANVGHVDATVGWVSTHAVRPADYAGFALRWRTLGATVIGGCCGTSPSYIRALSAVLS